MHELAEPGQANAGRHECCMLQACTPCSLLASSRVRAAGLHAGAAAAGADYSFPLAAWPPLSVPPPPPRREAKREGGSKIRYPPPKPDPSFGRNPLHPCPPYAILFPHN